MITIKRAACLFGAALLGQTLAPAARADDTVVIVGDHRDDDSGTTRPDANGPEFLRLRNVSYAGSGCPAGSLASDISPDGSALSLIWDEFVAETGPGVSLMASRKNCQLNIDLAYPSGWSYAVTGVSFRGYLNLDAGVRAEQASSYYFQGQAATARLSTSFYGPVSRDYLTRDTLGASAQVWSPCSQQRSLNINIQARLSSANRNARGLMTVESPIGNTLGGLELQWRRCW